MSALEDRNYFNDPRTQGEHVSGAYDVTCNRCAGRRVVPVVNLKALGPQEREAWERQEREEAAYRQVERMELMLGC